MWGIDNPKNVFEYITNIDIEKDFSVNALMLLDKYNSFPTIDRKNLENIQSENFIIKDIEIKSPNNPAKLLDAKLIKFTK